MSHSMESTTASVQPDSASPSIAWWRLPIVWMVIGGPALVVVAGFATLALALIYPDPVLSTAPNASKADLPAVQGRNHAATPSR